MKQYGPDKVNQASFAKRGYPAIMTTHEFEFRAIREWLAEQESKQTDPDTQPETTE